MVERGARVHLHRPDGDIGQSEKRLNHLSLLGDAQRAVNGSRRLRLDGDICRTATADRAAAAMEECYRDPAPLAGGDDCFLRAIELPRRRQTADVLGRIGIPDHHLLPARSRRR